MQHSRHMAPLLGLAALAVLAASPAGAQGLNGQLVQQTFRFPNTTTVFENDGTKLVTPLGANYSFSGGIITTVLQPTQVTFTFPNNDSIGSAGTFTGIVLSETGPLPATITGVTLASSTIPGFDASRVSFDAGDIFTNFTNLNEGAGQTVTLNFTTNALASTPEPSSVAAFGFTALGIAGLMLRARKRRAN